MQRISYLCAGGALIILNSCGNILDSKGLKENTIKCAEESSIKIGEIESPDALKKILTNFKKVLEADEDVSVNDIKENIDLFIENTTSFNFKNQGNKVKKYLEKISQKETTKLEKNKNNFEPKNNSKIIEIDPSKTNCLNWKKMFPEAKCLFDFDSYNKKNRMIKGDLLLEREMKIFELNKDNESKHLIVGPLLSCMAIVAHNSERVAVIHQRVEEQNQEYILNQINEKLKNSKYEILFYYNRDDSNSQENWINTFKKGSKNIKIDIQFNDLKKIDLEKKYGKLSFTERIAMWRKIEAETEDLAIRRNVELEPDLFLALSVEENKLKFRNTSILANNYLGLNFKNDLKEDYNTVEKHYHSLVNNKKNIKK